MKRLTQQKQSSRWSRIVLLSVALAAVIVLVAVGGGAYAMHLENRDSFCASCHTQPESRYFQQSLDANTPTLAAFHAQNEVNCIDCHSSEGPFGRLAGLQQGTQDLMAYYGNHYHDPAITTHQLGDGSCTKCHASTLTAASFNNHFHHFLPQWQRIDPQAAHCVDCHTSHPVASPDQTFLSAAKVQVVCQQCHFRLGEG